MPKQETLTPKRFIRSVANLSKIFVVQEETYCRGQSRIKLTADAKYFRNVCRISSAGRSACPNPVGGQWFESIILLQLLRLFLSAGRNTGGRNIHHTQTHTANSSLEELQVRILQSPLGAFGGMVYASIQKIDFLFMCLVMQHQFNWWNVSLPRRRLRVRVPYVAPGQSARIKCERDVTSALSTI